MKNLKRTLLRALSFVGVLGFAVAAALPGYAATKPSAEVSVVDDAGILSKQTEIYVSNISIALQDTCGAQIGVYTTEYIGNSTMEGYAYNLFNQWGLGSKKGDNGVLLLLAPGEDDYFLMRGEGLERDLSISVLSTLLDDEMDVSWTNADYDGGTQKTVRALAERLCSIYGVTMDVDAVGAGTAGSSTQKTGGFNVGGVLLVIGAVLLVLFLVGFLTSKNRRGPGAPPPPMGGARYAAPRRSSNYAGSFMAGMLGGMVSGGRRRRSYTRGPRFTAPPRQGGSNPFGGSRPSGTGRTSGGMGGGFKPSGGSFRAGGGSTRGGGVGRKH